MILRSSARKYLRLERRIQIPLIAVFLRLQCWCSFRRELAMEDENVPLRRIFQFHRLTKIFVVDLRTFVEILRCWNVSPFVFVRVTTVDDLQGFDLRRIDIAEELDHLNQRTCRRERRGKGHDVLFRDEYKRDRHVCDLDNAVRDTSTNDRRLNLDSNLEEREMCPRASPSSDRYRARRTL